MSQPNEGDLETPKSPALVRETPETQKTRLGKENRKLLSPVGLSGGWPQGPAAYQDDGDRSPNPGDRSPNPDTDPLYPALDLTLTGLISLDRDVAGTLLLGCAPPPYSAIHTQPAPVGVRAKR